MFNNPILFFIKTKNSEFKAENMTDLYFCQVNLSQNKFTK